MSLSVVGRREVLVGVIGAAAEEVDDRELLAVPTEGVDVYITSKDADGKTLAELATWPVVRGVYVRKIVRGATATEIPILADTKLNRGDIVTLTGRTQDIAAATKALGARGSRHRCHRRRLYGSRYRHRCAGWRIRVEGRRRAADLVDVRRRIDFRHRLRLAALGAADFRTHSLAGRCGS